MEDGFGDQDAAEGEHGDEAHAAGEAGEEHGGVLSPFHTEAFAEVVASEEGAGKLGEHACGESGAHTADEAEAEHD